MKRSQDADEGDWISYEKKEKVQEKGEGFKKSSWNSKTGQKSNYRNQNNATQNGKNGKVNENVRKFEV